MHGQRGLTIGGVIRPVGWRNLTYLTSSCRKQLVAFPVHLAKAMVFYWNKFLRSSVKECSMASSLPSAKTRESTSVY